MNHLRHLFLYLSSVPFTQETEMLHDRVRIWMDMDGRNGDTHALYLAATVALDSLLPEEVEEGDLAHP